MDKETALYVECKVSLFYDERTLYYCDYSLPV